MTFDTVEAFVRASFEPLQYAAFFGVFAVFALLEGVAPRDPSPAMRLWRWPSNVALTAVNIVVLGALPVGIVAAADFSAGARFGLLHSIDVAPWAAFAIGFLGRAFLSWGTHLLNHKVPFLWAIHRVHHADTRLDVSTTVRFHPLEFVFTTPLTLAGVVLLGAPPVAILIYELLDASVTVFSHANVRLPWWVDRPLRLFIVTPDVHRVHHSSHQPETDSNYGAVLTIWDRLLGTYRRKSAQDLAAQETGLSETQDARSRNLFWLLILPFIALKSRAVAFAEDRR
ncbi:MAG: sterol desaturase family protein [Alphaproteobacteria bacterium]|nr:sterol desaturase family protein [Alphaproteobacteria bacterium]